MPRFPVGCQITIREVLHGRVWTERPVTVLADDECQLVTYLAPGTRTLYPADVEHGERCIRMWLDGQWTLLERIFEPPGIVRVAPWGADFEAWVLFDDSGLRHAGWYVNFQRPLTRTAAGVETMDEVLDLLVAPDMSSVRLKDDEELDIALSLGLFDEAKVSALRERAADVTEAILHGRAPWDTSWATWRPSAGGGGGSSVARLPAQ